MDISELTFDEFQSMNIERCRRAFSMCDDWTLNDWAVALSGEVGEMCNILKKVRRGDAVYSLDPDNAHEKATRRELLKELADIITYADLMVSQLSGATGEELLTKFNEVSKRVGYGPVVASASQEGQ